MPHLYEILSKHAPKKWKTETLAALAHTYLLLQPKDRKALPQHIPDKLSSIIKKTDAECVFPPLLLLADQCVFETTERMIGDIEFEEWIMPELYRTVYNRLQGVEKIKFNAQFGKDIVKEPPLEIYLLSLQFNRSGAEARLRAYSLYIPPISVSISSTHQYLSSSNTLKMDPIADDCAFFQDEHYLLTSLSDGGGHGENVAKAAAMVNAFFIKSLYQLKDLQLSPLETLRQATLKTAELFEKSDNPEASTHSGLFARLNPSSGIIEVGISLLGDTGAYLLIVWDDESLYLEKLLPLSSDKSVSSNGGCISAHSDFGNLRLCQFIVPSRAKNVYIIQASDGLWDNFDPRNALKNEVSDAIAALMNDKNKFYSPAELPLEIGKIPLSAVYLNAKDQKIEQVYNATHRFPDPGSLQQYLNPNLSPSKERKSWKEANLDELIPLYEKSMIEEIYRSSTPRTFATNLVEFAKRQGKPDDICVLVANITFVVHN